MSAVDEKAKKAAKKAKLKAEAESLGITYEALKAQKKDKKENKRKREADNLNADNVEFDGGAGRAQEQKRMRTWSGDFDGDKTEKKNGTAANNNNNNDEGPATKRLRTRSMDKAEDNAIIVQAEKSQSTSEWRKSHDITLKGYGTNANSTFMDPFIEFGDAPFNPTIQNSLKAAGFERPSLVQAQVSNIIYDVQ